MAAKLRAPTRSFSSSEMRSWAAASFFPELANPERLVLPGVFQNGEICGLIGTGVPLFLEDIDVDFQRGR